MYRTCTIACLHGHQFPDGSSITTMSCKDGYWLPDKEKWTSLPDCERKLLQFCNIFILIENFSNLWSSMSEWRQLPVFWQMSVSSRFSRSSVSIQYAFYAKCLECMFLFWLSTGTDNCDARKLQFNGGYNCSGDQVGLICSLSCPEGMTFETRPSSVYSCLYEEARFQPSPIPQCIFRKCN